MIELTASQLAASDATVRGVRETNTRVLTLSHDFVRVLRDRGQALAASASQDSRAKGFGETGLFRPAVPWNADQVPAAAAADAGEGEPSPTICGVGGEAGQSSPEGAAPMPNSVTPRSAGTVIEQPSVGLRTVETVPSTATPMASASVAGRRPGSEAAKIPSSAATTRGPNAPTVVGSAAQAASLPLHVAVDALERGIAVRIAVAELDPAEQRELADRVVELLSHHGFANAAVSLNGARPISSLIDRGQDTWR